MDKYHDGHKIILKPGQQDNEVDMSVCDCEIRQTDMGKRSGYREGSFGSRQEAETAALATAKAVIDSNSR
jgi:hypothetical protein